MKALGLSFAVWALCSTADAAANKGDKTIGKVVKLLEEMLEKSKTEGEEERIVFAKYKCYCDKNEKEKKQSIEELTSQIDFLTTNIAELQAENGALTQECTELTSKMVQNEATRKEAESLREQSHEAFEQQEDDMKAAIDGFKDAIEVLKEIGGDSLLTEGTKFMAGHKESLVARKTLSQSKLAQMQTTVRSALAAATAFLTSEERTSVEGFLQSPSTGVVASKSSGAIAGVLEKMLDTFKENLDNAKDAEKAEKKAHEKFMKDKEEEHAMFAERKDDKVEIISGNDDELATKKEQLTESKQQLEDDQEFLAKLTESCETKSKEYEKRQMLRKNEEAAIAEAISILDSDDAFATFGKTEATSTGATGFLQTASVRNRATENEQTVAVRVSATSYLRKAAQKTRSMKLTKVVLMLEKKNPFDRVIKEIESMLKLIVEEHEADEKQLDWCNSEREANDEELEKRTTQIETLEGEIDELDDSMHNADSGLETQIKDTEEDISENQDEQTMERKTRLEEKKLHFENVKNLKAAEAILKRASAVLKRYYDSLERHLEEESFLQVHEDPAPPEAEFNTAGQSESGNEVMDMLQFILEETEKEREQAESDEADSQSTYEDTMSTLKEQLETLQDQLATLKEDHAEKEKEFLQKTTDLKDTKHAKKAIEEYIKEIEPGCDFITENFETREENRKTETEALEKADALIKDTPAYKKFEEKKKDD